MGNAAVKILIVEDDQFLREFYTELLRDEGYTIDSAADGDMALSKMLQGGFDLVLLDIMLPRKDGLQILKEYKLSQPQNPNKSIIMLTNLGQEAVIQKCFELGANGYLIKSGMNPDQVLNEIRNHLKLV